MNIAVLSCGAVVVNHGERSWLFGAPKGITYALKEAGIDKPEALFTTNIRAPGKRDLGEILSFKELPLNMGGLSARPIQRKHGGVDYEIEAEGAKVLFSERGDVATKLTDDYDLAIIRNKHRSSDMADHVITYPWPDAEFKILDHELVKPYEEVRLKVWSDLADVPANLKNIGGVPLTLGQANFIAKVAKASADGPDENFAVGISAFKKAHRKDGNKWVKKQGTETAEKSMQQTLARHQSDFNEQFKNLSGSNNSGMVEPHYWVQDLDIGKAVIYVNVHGTTYEVPYEHADDGYAYAPKSEWREALQTWTAIKEKYTKADVNYRDAESGSKEMCGTCRFFQRGDDEDDSKCQIVTGSISYSDTCDQFKAAEDFTVKDLDASGRPIRKLGEMFVADLHKTYNDVSDKWLKEGYINQEERIQIAGAIGKALGALNKSFPEQVFNRIHPDDMVPQQFKELAPDVPELLDEGGPWFNVYKDDETVRWVTISSVASWDRQDELFTTKAMDWAIAFSKFIGRMGPLRFKHVPGLDGGDCDTQIRVGDFLFESGTFRDNDVGLAMQTLWKEAPEKWQVSVGLAYAKGDIVEGKYERAAIFERSMTERPAHPNTSLLVTKEGDNQVSKIMTDDQLQQAAEALGLDLTEVKTMYERAMSTGIFGEGEFKEFALKQEEVTTKGGGKGKKGKMPYPKGEDDEEMDEEQEKSLKDVVADLSADELAELETTISAVKEEQEAAPPTPAEETPEAVAELQTEVTELKEAVLVMTKSIKDIAGQVAEATKKPKVSIADEVSAALTGLPRSQANGLVTAAKEQQSDEEPMDEAQIHTMLKQIMENQQQMAGQIPTQDNVYDLFTSKNLNRQ